MINIQLDIQHLKTNIQSINRNLHDIKLSESYNIILLKPSHMLCITGKRLPGPFNGDMYKSRHVYDIKHTILYNIIRMHLNVLQRKLEKLCNKLKEVQTFCTYKCACHIPSVIQNTKTLMESLDWWI